MAGIGFVLRELNRKETIIGSVSSLGHGMIVAAGPWIFTVVSLALIHRGTSALLSSDAGYNFRSFIMYAFAVSLVATAPVVNVSVRLTSNDIYRRTFTWCVPAILPRLLQAACCRRSCHLRAHFSVFTFSRDLLIAVGSTAVVSLVWPTLAFCGAVRDYKGITAGFGGRHAGFGHRHNLGREAWVGHAAHDCHVFVRPVNYLLCSCQPHSGCISRSSRKPRAQLAELASGLRQHWMLAAGSLLPLPPSGPTSGSCGSARIKCGCQTGS